METADILTGVEAIARGFASQRRERQARRELDLADFDQLREAGFPLLAVPKSHGGAFASGRESMREVCTALRLLAHGDSSVALVASMHPAVLAITGWLEANGAPAPEHAAAWAAQREWVFETARDGHFWGTITSEPGSGGDLMRTKAAAVPDAARGPLAYRVSGTKHFGSGSGAVAFMITSAVAAGETQPDWFFFDTRPMQGHALHGMEGVRVTAPWDGAGMAATQSHALELADTHATRVAWPGIVEKTAAVKHLGGPAMFAAVITGVVEVAMETARAQLAPRWQTMRPYEQVEWTRAETEAWLIAQAYEGMLRAIEQDGGRRILLGKNAVAELAEQCLSRVAKVVGGGAYSRSSPYPYWYEDVRALGFLRPPWGLAFDQARADLAPPSPA